MKEDRLREYVAETYQTGNEKILSLLKEYLPNPEVEDPDWQVTVLKGKVGVVITERPRALERILILGLRGEKLLFRRATQD